MLKESKKLKRVFVGLSGGVDSSVAAYLLKREGFDVVGVHLRCWNRNGCSASDAEDARRVAKRLDIPFYVLDLEKEYKNKVVDYMVDGYARGITPNPDVMCNKEIKFGLFLKKALEMGADYIATGHYVRLRELSTKRKDFISSTRFARPATRSLITRRSSRYNRGPCRAAAWVSDNKIFSLYTAKDTNKDQSYFLWTLTQKQLRHCLFPIGDYLKSEVRAIAKKAGLLTADKKDSQGLCFVGKVTLKEFLGERIPPRRGEILDTVGNVLGEHEGAQFYTVGQRHGLGLCGGKPRYVVSKNAFTNTIILAEGSDSPDLFKKEISLASINWTGGVPKLPFRILTRVRYRQPPVMAVLMKIKTTSYKLIFDESQKFVAPGQSAVFYSQEGRMLGGGVIL